MSKDSKTYLSTTGLSTFKYQDLHVLYTNRNEAQI